MRSTFSWAGLVCSVACSSAMVVDAHASMVSSTPRSGSAVGASPPEITMTFSEALHPRDSSIRVFDISGRQMNSGNIVRVSEDKTTIATSLPALPSGAYKVKWNAVCDCAEHRSEQGVFIFLVR